MLWCLSLVLHPFPDLPAIPITLGCKNCGNPLETTSKTTVKTCIIIQLYMLNVFKHLSQYTFGILDLLEMDGVTTPGTHALRTATPSSTCQECEELRFCIKSLYGATFPSCKSIAGEVSPQTHDNPIFREWMQFCYWACIMAMFLFFSQHCFKQAKEKTCFDMS